MWASVEIAGKTADVFEPDGGKPRFGLIHLHDGSLETLRDKADFTRWLSEFRMVCVCPHGGLCWWADRVCPPFDARLTPEKYVIERVLPYCGERWQLRPRAVGIHGISMGGQGAFRIAFKHARLFPVVAAIAASFDCHEMYGQGTPLDEMYDSKEQCRQDTALMHIPPSDYPPHIFFSIDPEDRWYRSNDRMHEKLTALGIAHEFVLTPGSGGHSWESFNRAGERSLRFIHAGLEQESRRLL